MKVIKFAISILALLSINFGCSEKIIDKLEPKVPDFISADELKSLLPSILQSSGQKYAIFKDKDANEHRMNISVSSDMNLLEHNGTKYRGGTHTIDFITDDNKVAIRLLASSNIYGDAEIQKAQSLIIGYVNHFNPLGILINYDYSTKNVSLLSSKKLASLQIINKIFNNVFISDANNNDIQYKSLGFNFEYGIVSYSDAEGHLYVFDRYGS